MVDGMFASAEAAGRAGAEALGRAEEGRAGAEALGRAEEEALGRAEEGRAGAEALGKAGTGAGTAETFGPVRISVAMPVYNGERFLREQLDSILEQLSGEDEIIVSDDGSSDHTPAILSEYEKKCSGILKRFQVLKGPGRGVKQNVGFALAHCRGSYIFLADQDDIWIKGKAARVLELFERQQAGLIVHDAVVFTEDVKQPLMDSFFRFRNARAGIVKNFTKNSYIGCCMAFRRELLKQALPIPEDIEMHDQWIGILNDFYYKNSYFYEKPLIYYRRHGENNSGLTHYGPMKMIRNRLVFLWRFLGRILIENRKWKK